MRIFLLILLFLSLSIFSYGQQRGFTPVLVKMGASAGTLYEQSHALVIGISDYSNGWPDLPGVKNDIDAVKTTFELHGFNVVTKENLSKEQMDEAFSEFISQYGQVENARLVIYFAGHGHTIKTSYGDKLGYIVPANAPNPNQNPAAFQKAALEMAQIEIYAKRIQSKHVLFLFDACFSGNLFAISRSVPEAISYKTSMPVRQFITSGDENETVPDKSIFKQQLVMALTSKFADANNDGYLTGTELGEYLFNNVVNYSYNTQHPQYGKIRHPQLDKGDFVFSISETTQKEVSEKPTTPDQTYKSPPMRPTLPPVQTTNPTMDLKPASALKIGNVESLGGYGTLEINSEIGGDLIIDGQKVGTLVANTKVPVSGMTPGLHSIEIRGKQYWLYNATVSKDQTTSVYAKAKLPTSQTITPKVPIQTPTKQMEDKNTFIDKRDNKKYKFALIGEQTWMAQNLNYETEEGSSCYEDSAINCQKFGRIYDFNNALEACPEGWHLPTAEEWDALLLESGGYKGSNDAAFWSLTEATTNSLQIQLTGWRDRTGIYDFMEFETMFWSGSELNSNYAWNAYFDGRNNDALITNTKKTFGLYVRCVKD